MNNFKYFIGTDPGKTGACFVLDAEGNPLGVARPRLRKIWGRKVFDPRALMDDLEEIIYEKFLWGEIFVLIEQVNSYKQGSSSAFSFAANSAGILLVFETLGCTVKTITSTEWKKKARVDSSQLGEQGSTDAEQSKLLKNLSAEKARKTFPQFKFKKSEKADEEEASLLAWLAWNSAGSNTNVKISA